jgi:hypothetical protein
MTEIKVVSTNEAMDLLKGIRFNLTDEKVMDFCMLMSTDIWAGFVDGGLVCIWGVIPPTLLSQQAYMWLFTTDLIKQHQFLLVRHSQVVIEQVLEEYQSVVGHVIIGSDKSIRWLKWLGAKFGPPSGSLVPFRISRNG